METLKRLLVESSVVYLSKDQILYRFGSQDNFIYFVLFGRLNLTVPGGGETLSHIRDGTSNADLPELAQQTNHALGRVSIGWSLGEEVLFERTSTNRRENCYSETESCLLGIDKSKLAMLQKELLDSGNTKDYFVLESTLKGNYLLKQNWKKDMIEGKATGGTVNLERIEGLTINNFNKANRLAK